MVIMKWKDGNLVTVRKSKKHFNQCEKTILDRFFPSTISKRRYEGEYGSGNSNFNTNLEVGFAMMDANGGND